MNDPADIRAAYLVELRQKTLRGGRLFALIASTGMIYAVFQDLLILKISAAAWFRAIGLLGALSFLVASFSVFRKRPEWIIPWHIVQTSSVVVQMCGFTCALFYTQPDLPTYPYGTTSGIIICMLAAFVFAYGARRALWIILIVPLALTIAFLLLFCSPAPEEFALFFNPIAICPALIAVALSQERTAFRELHMRKLAIVRQEELEVAAEALRSSNRDLEHFAREASHDLRQPLNSIVGFTELIQEELPSGCEGQAEIEQYLDKVIGAAGRMRTLIDDLLDYARLDAEKKAFTPTDMNEVFTEAIHNLDYLVKETGATITSGKLPTVQGNAPLLVAALQNLIGNAIKYRREDAVPQIDLSCSLVDGFHRISVRDNGIGFDPKYIKEVFKPFVRLHPRDAYPGTGMGLASCLKIVKQHGGTVDAVTQPGSGSTFFFDLPSMQ